MFERKQSMGTSRQSDLPQVQAVEQYILCAIGVLVLTEHRNISSSICPPMHPSLHPFLITPAFSETLW